MARRTSKLARSMLLAVAVSLIPALANGVTVSAAVARVAANASGGPAACLNLPVSSAVITPFSCWVTGPTSMVVAGAVPDAPGTGATVIISEQHSERSVFAGTGPLRIKSFSGQRLCLEGASGRRAIDLSTAPSSSTAPDACAGIAASAASALTTARSNQRVFPVATPTAPAAAPRSANILMSPEPTPSASLYVYGSYVSKCGATSTWGCPLYVAGARAPVPFQFGGIDVIDFGAPCYSGVVGAEVYGTQLFGTSSCTPDAQLVTLAKAWLRGYASGHGPVSSVNGTTVLALGTSNSLTGALPDPHMLTAAQMQAHAQAWYTLLVQPIMTAVAGQPATITVAAASDIEQSSGGDWYDPAHTRPWVDAYSTAAGNPTSKGCGVNGVGALFDYGDNVLTGGWTSADIYHVAWESPSACPLPEVYYPAMATTWNNLNAWALSQSPPKQEIQFGAVMSEDGYAGSLSAHESWAALSSATGWRPLYITVIGLTTMTSSRQYSLANSDGSTWVPIDPLRLSQTTYAATNTVAIVSANADLWTATAGYNQDLGIFVSTNNYPDTLLAWKESGGRVATFSPNAAFVQGTMPLAAGTTYTFTLKWKTNRAANGVTIFAGAGLGPVFSPTNLAFHFVSTDNSRVSAQQYRQAGSDGATWKDIDASGLSLPLNPSVTSSAVIGGNADLWTASDGINQDLAITISGGSFGSGQVVAWKESGGNAGTFSPNAAFVQAVVSLNGGTAYTVTLQWKANHTTGATIFAGAGLGPQFSPTSLIAELIPAGGNPSTQVSTQQYQLSNSDATTWVALDPALDVPVSVSGSDALALVSANADLWTANAGYDQDIGVFVSVNGGPESLVVWKESGGYGGTFSPNAAFAQGLYPLSAGDSYVFRLRWKANRTATGATIFAGAGLGPVYSPTRLTVETISG